MPSERMRYLKFIPTAPEPPRPTRDELRAQLDAMPHARLVDLVLDLTDADHELLLRVRRIVLAQTDAVAAVTLLRAEIDRTLCVDYIEWNAVRMFVNELEFVQGEIHALGRTDANAALDLGFYFLDALPRVFDAVHGECELQMFSEDFARTTILSMAAATETPFEMAAERLLRAVAADGYGHFNDITDVVRGACTTPAMERALLRVAEEVARQPDGGGRWVVENLVGALRLNR